MTQPGKKLRRERIVVAALAEAAAGYEGMQVRVVAERAGVAASTVYLHFPSKDDLLVACLLRWLGDFQTASTVDAIHNLDSYQRLIAVAEALTRSLCENLCLTEALVRAYVYADGTAAAGAGLVRQKLIQTFTPPRGTDEPSHHQYRIAELVTDVWVTNIVAITQNRLTPSQLLQRLQRTIAIIRGRDGEYRISDSGNATTVAQGA